MIIKEPRGNMSGVYLVQPDDKNKCNFRLVQIPAEALVNSGLAIHLYD